MTTAIMVLNGPSYGTALGSMGPKITEYKEFLKNPKEFRLVLFTGGPDVMPSLYGHSSPKGLCCYNSTRDIIEKRIFEIAVENEIPMAGICRGFQFINVMAGGTLIHHLDGHEGCDHHMECQHNGRVININSLHHQMVIPPKNAFITGWCPIKLSEIYYGDKDRPIDWAGPEVEAAIFPDIKAFGVQYHPEMMDSKSEGYKLFFSMVYDIIYKNIYDFVNIYNGEKRIHA